MIKKAKSWIVSLEHIGAEIIDLRNKLNETLEIHVESTDTEDKETAEMIRICDVVVGQVDRLEDFLRLQVERKKQQKKQPKKTAPPSESQTRDAVRRLTDWLDGDKKNAPISMTDGIRADIHTILHSPHVSITQSARP